MHDRAADPIGAAISPTTTDTEIMVLLSIEFGYITSETARRGKCLSSAHSWSCSGSFSFAFLAAFCEEESYNSSQLEDDDYEN